VGDAGFACVGGMWRWCDSCAAPSDDRTDAGMSEKYGPLQRYLEHADRQHAVTMTIAQIESILGDALPASAKRFYSF
jgi:hypothetical protein